MIRGEAGDELLDTYHAERHPVAARVLQASRAQGVLFVPDEDVAALREVFGELVDARALAERVAGLDHGDRVPGLDLSLLHDGRRHVIDGVPVRPDGFRDRPDRSRDQSESSGDRLENSRERPENSRFRPEGPRDRLGGSQDRPEGSRD